MPKEHKIRQGESIISVAELYGFFAGTLWDHPSNAALKEKRRYMNVLHPGDVVSIPDKHEKNVACGTGSVHTFKRRGIPALLRLRLLEEEVPRANVPYRLIIGGREQRGVTDADGVLEEFVSPGAREGALFVGDDDDLIALKFGDLDPIEEVSGLQARLGNLGFSCGEPPSGEMDDATRDALAAFQRRFGLEETGEPDEATRGKLFALHDDHADADPR
jgi:hypothetical protein